MPQRYWICILCLFCAPLHAEEIQLKDGTKITGKLTAVSGDTFQVKTAYGDIQVPRAEVISISFPENQPKKDSTESKPRAPVDESLNGASYKNGTANFQLTVPQGWVLAPEMGTQSPDIVGSLKSLDEANFVLVTNEKFSGTLNTYKALVETNYQTKFTEYEKLSEASVQMDGKTAMRMIWHGKNKSANDTPIKALIFILPYENRMLRLSFVTVEALFDENLPIFEKIAASYQTTSTK